MPFYYRPEGAAFTPRPGASTSVTEFHPRPPWPLYLLASLGALTWLAARNEDGEPSNDAEPAAHTTAAIVASFTACILAGQTRTDKFYGAVVPHVFAARPATEIVSPVVSTAAFRQLKAHAGAMLSSRLSQKYFFYTCGGDEMNLLLNDKVPWHSVCQLLPIYACGGDGSSPRRTQGLPRHAAQMQVQNVAPKLNNYPTMDAFFVTAKDWDRFCRCVQGNTSTTHLNADGIVASRYPGYRPLVVHTGALRAPLTGL